MRRTVVEVTKAEVRERYGLAGHGLPHAGTSAVLSEDWKTGEKVYLVTDEVDGHYLVVHELPNGVDPLFLHNVPEAK
jgi:hypothetical protein